MAADLSFYTSPLSQEIRDEGKAEGKAEGVALGEARSLLRVLAGRGIEVPAPTRARVMDTGDTHVLNRWLDRAITATTLDDVFTEDSAQD